MSIEKNQVVAFHYTLTDSDGNEVENSRDGEPMVYLHGGYRNLLQKLEEAFSGREKGEEFAVTLPPEHAYGIRQEGSAQRIPIKHLLTKHKRYRPGMAVKVNTKEGPRDVVVIKVGKFNLDVDLNHPLAGMTVTFNVAVENIRDATADEISHRHSHDWDATAQH